MFAGDAEGGGVGVLLSFSMAPLRIPVIKYELLFLPRPISLSSDLYRGGRLYINSLCS